MCVCAQHVCYVHFGLLVAGPGYVSWRFNSKHREIYVLMISHFSYFRTSHSAAISHQVSDTPRYDYPLRALPGASTPRFAM